MSTAVAPKLVSPEAGDFAVTLQAAFERGGDARADGFPKRWNHMYEDLDLAQAWRVGWEAADRELSEHA